MGKYYALLLLIFVFRYGSAQTFSRATIPPSNQQYAVTSLLSANGMFVSGGYYQDTTQNLYSATLVAIDSTGSIQWEYLYTPVPGTSLILMDIASSPDGIYACGHLYDSTNYEAFISKFDYSGNELWSRYLFVGGTQVVSTADSGCVTISGGFLIKFDKNGILQWSKLVSGPDNSMELVSVANCDVIFFGRTNYNSYYHPCVGRVDSAGNLLWYKRLTTPTNTGVFFVDGAATADGGFVVVSNAGVTKIDQNGALQWNKVYTINGYGVPDCVVGMNDSTILVGAETIFTAPFWDQWIFCLNLQGNVLWSAVDTSGLLSSVSDMVGFSGSRFAIITNETNFASYVDFALVVTDTVNGYHCSDTIVFPTEIAGPMAVSSASVASTFTTSAAPVTFVRSPFGVSLVDLCTGQFIGMIEQDEKDVRLYPNPVIDELVIESPYSNAEVRFYNVNGVCVKLNVISIGKQIIEVQDLPVGMYFISVIASGELVHSGKLLKQ